MTEYVPIADLTPALRYQYRVLERVLRSGSRTWQTRREWRAMLRYHKAIEAVALGLEDAEEARIEAHHEPHRASEEANAGRAKVYTMCGAPHAVVSHSKRSITVRRMGRGLPELDTFRPYKRWGWRAVGDQPPKDQPQLKGWAYDDDPRVRLR